ncbi:hypothetical protein [Streptomyces sp. MMBL 11-1]|uniref:hypothetical protein n=1 Tax=Streptomyces sp. MMBL 11-1 TaxID=3026420 RepID=UPI0023604B31|nr:hypothetical protein [Streptomyces sp. MMBL 11-1]
MIMLALGLLIVAGFVALLLLARGIRRGVDSLRAEVAAARVAGVLGKDDPVP